MSANTGREALDLIRRLGVARPIDLEARGVPRSRLYRLAREGLVERASRGLYVVADHEATAEHCLALAARRVPNGVICLLSALQFHDLTTQLPHQVWMAIPEKARRPRLDYPPLRIARFSGPSLAEGVETYEIEGVPVQITSVAKTVADCFKYRNKIGLDVALEALKDAWRDRRVRIAEIDRSAQVCRVRRVMRPYLEALVA